MSHWKQFEMAQRKFFWNTAITKPLGRMTSTLSVFCCCCSYNSSRRVLRLYWLVCKVISMRVLQTSSGLHVLRAVKYDFIYAEGVTEHTCSFVSTTQPHILASLHSTCLLKQSRKLHYKLIQLFSSWFSCLNVFEDWTLKTTRATWKHVPPQTLEGRYDHLWLMQRRKLAAIILFFTSLSPSQTHLEVVQHCHSLRHLRAHWQ